MRQTGNPFQFVEEPPDASECVRGRRVIRSKRLFFRDDPEPGGDVIGTGEGVEAFGTDHPPKIIPVVAFGDSHR